MTNNLPSEIKRTRCIETGEEADHHAAAAAIKVLPGQWFEAIIGVEEVLETEQTVAQA